jgi:DNA-binding response OmpR family regulator
MAAKTRVLVIDDDVTLANLLCMLLEKDGFEALTASNGNDGLKIARREKPEAIILDVMMPGMHGYEVCKRLRKITDAVIVFVSVKGTTEDIGGQALYL